MALQRADHAVAKAAMTTMSNIRGLFDAKSGVPAEVFTRLAGLPVLLRTSGLLPMLAFYAAKGGSGRELERAYSIVGAAMRGQVAGVLGMQQGSDLPALDHAFLEELTTGLQRDPVALARATRRLEDFSGWLRRLSEAVKREQAAAQARQTAAAQAAGRESAGQEPVGQESADA
jgi:CRISPR/Cas system CMR-associated protein Cmr5 small subunit